MFSLQSLLLLSSDFNPFVNTHNTTHILFKKELFIKGGEKTIQTTTTC